MTKATTVVVTFTQFAEGIGRSDRITLEASLDWHRQYVMLDASSKSAWKRDWLVNYVFGRLDCTRKQAEAICDKTRVQRTASEEKAVNTGSKRFSDHISRTTIRSGKKPSNPVVVPKQLLNSIKSEIIDAGLTKAQFDALIAQLRDSVAFQ